MKKLLVFGLLAGFSWPAMALERITVMLDWFVNPDQAPLIVAKQMGFFTAHDLDVEIIEPSDPSAAPRLAAAGKADLAFDSEPNLIMQRSENLPLIKVSTIIGSPLNNLLAKQDSGIGKLADFKGKTIGYSIAGYDTVILNTMLRTVGLSLDDVTTVNVNFAITQSLLAGKTDGIIGAYRIFENLELQQQGQKPLAFYPEDYGVPHYEEMILVAAEDKMHDPRFARFNAALAEAVNYMNEHPEEAWRQFISYKDGLDDPLNRASWEAVLPLFAKHPDRHDAAGYQAFASFLQKNGLTKAVIAVPVYQPPQVKVKP